MPVMGRHHQAGMDLSLNINSYRNGLIIALLHNGLQVAVSFLSIVNSCIIQKVLLFL
jgi:hypothetical protein